MTNKHKQIIFRLFTEHGEIETTWDVEPAQGAPGGMLHRMSLLKIPDNLKAKHMANYTFDPTVSGRTWRMGAEAKQHFEKLPEFVVPSFTIQLDESLPANEVHIK